MKDLIALANAHATKHPGAGQPWKVEANITNEPLAHLDGNFSELQVFAILKFARKFEQTALEAGIAFQKKLSAEMYEGQIERLREMNLAAGRENERLADKLGQLIGEKE